MRTTLRRASSILDHIAGGLAQSVAVPNVRQRGPWIAVPCKILKVNDIGPALTGVGESRAEGVHGNRGIESQSSHVTFDQKLHVTPGERSSAKTIFPFA